MATVPKFEIMSRYIYDNLESVFVEMRDIDT